MSDEPRPYPFTAALEAEFARLRGIEARLAEMRVKFPGLDWLCWIAEGGDELD